MIRNKSLDSGYFRASLHLLGAAELLFAQYESYIRSQAKPNGFVGMGTVMHSNIEQGALFNKELKPVKEAMTDFRAVYQTSLGLGSSFPKDSQSRSKREAKRSRRRSYPRGGWYGAPGVGRGLQEHVSYAARGGLSFAQNLRGSGLGLAENMSRGRGACYAFQAGECRRGSSCRYSHTS